MAVQKQEKMFRLAVLFENIAAFWVTARHGAVQDTPNLIAGQIPEQGYLGNYRWINGGHSACPSEEQIAAGYQAGRRLSSQAGLDGFSILFAIAQIIWMHSPLST
ncbi:hypothetical protein [Ferrovibrio sp.]|uniref:hypothetical protein n=1 Tax=Ferrovibrio sp. TaxID=1917215 RepID=UPI0035B217C6